LASTTLSAWPLRQPSSPRRHLWCGEDGKIREDGRLVRDMYLFQVKSPEESKYKFDYYKLLATVPGNEEFRPMEEGGCPLLNK
jgi:branched-chain amino acid transport system substrate-binding protein